MIWRRRTRAAAAPAIDGAAEPDLRPRVRERRRFARRRPHDDPVSDETRDAVQRRVVGVPPEVLRQVKLIELRTRRLVNSLFAGEYRSVFKGQGMEFAEVREYLAGDEVRTID